MLEMPTFRATYCTLRSVCLLYTSTVTVDLTDSGLDFNAVSMTEDDVAVISVPAYAGRIPAVVADRLGMGRGNGARAVLVCVYGNRAFEDTLVELEDVGSLFQGIAGGASVSVVVFLELVRDVYKRQCLFPLKFDHKHIQEILYLFSYLLTPKHQTYLEGCSLRTHKRCV